MTNKSPTDMSKTTHHKGLACRYCPPHQVVFEHTKIPHIDVVYRVNRHSQNGGIFSVLRAEHDVVLGLLDKLEENFGKKDLKSSEKNIAILEKEFNKHSLNKEEKALFPEIEKFMPREGGPTGMMVIEHEDLVKSIKNCKDAVKAGDFNKLDYNGSHIINLLRQHIDKENNMLFMMADMHLDEKQKKAISEKFKKFD
ncbi:MAG: hemerythrin domain-containing protein [Candidatus Woesearchaeota archaeon]|nr:hemerythrin domain-containing protein [Candidatus Woesearchaeota archaeon]